MSSRIRSGVTLSWFAKFTCATGAKSQTPRHSSSWSVMSSSSDSSWPWRIPAASWAASYTSPAPRSMQARLVHTLTTWVPVGRRRNIE